MPEIDEQRREDGPSLVPAEVDRKAVAHEREPAEELVLVQEKITYATTGTNTHASTASTIAISANRNDWSFGGSPAEPTASHSTRAGSWVERRMRRRATAAAYIADHASQIRSITAMTETRLTPSGVWKIAIIVDSTAANAVETSAPPTRNAGTPAAPPEKPSSITVMSLRARSKSARSFDPDAATAKRRSYMRRMSRVRVLR